MTTSVPPNLHLITCPAAFPTINITPANPAPWTFRELSWLHYEIVSLAGGRRISAVKWAIIYHRYLAEFANKPIDLRDRNYMMGGRAFLGYGRGEGRWWREVVPGVGEVYENTLIPARSLVAVRAAVYRHIGVEVWFLWQQGGARAITMEEHRDQLGYRPLLIEP